MRLALPTICSVNLNRKWPNAALACHVFGKIASSSASEITRSPCFQVRELIVPTYLLSLGSSYPRFNKLGCTRCHTNRKCSLANIKFISQNHHALMFTVTHCFKTSVSVKKLRVSRHQHCDIHHLLFWCGILLTWRTWIEG